MLRALYRLLITSLILAGISPGARGTTLDEANALFSAGEFAKAASAFDSLIASEGPTASRLYNLGNARFRLKEYGPAILAYERAALLAPRDPDIATNLTLARKSAASYDEREKRSWWESVLDGLSLGEWSWALLVSAALPGLSALAWGFAGFSRPWLKRSALTALSLGIVAGSLSGFALWYRRSEKNLGIITGDSTLHVSPFEESGSAGKPGTGKKVELGDRKNGWVYVTVPGSSLSGWLPEKDAPALMIP